MEATPVRSDSIEAVAKLRKELCIFFAALGVLTAIGAYFSLTGLRDSRIPLWGAPRHLAIGVPLGVIAGIHLLAAILLATARGRVAALLGAVASSLLAVFYVAFMISATGTLPITLITAVIAAIPILVWQRTTQFLSMAGGRSAA